MKGPLIEQIEIAGAVAGDVPTFDAVLNRMGFKQPLALLTTKGDIIARTSSAPARVGIGADGTILQADSASTPGLKWALPTEQVLYDAKGDILIGSADNARNRLGVGSNGQVLTADSAQTLGVKWANSVAGSVAIDALWDNKGDLVAATGADAAVKVPLGTDGYVLTADATQTAGVKWAVSPGSGSLADPTTTKGDLIVRDATAPARLAVGADSKILVADSSQATGLKWSFGWGRPFPLDLPPASANAKDDEFDGTSSVTWLATPTAASATAINAADSPDQLLITSAGVQFQGLVQAVPGAYPYTIMACLSDTDLQGSADRGGGLVLAPASPVGTSNIVYVGDANLIRFAGMYNFNGTFVSVAGVQPTRLGRIYMKIKVNAANSIDSWINQNGSGWVRRHNTFNPGFTPGVMGLVASRGTGGAGSSSFFDWFRVS